MPESIKKRRAADTRSSGDSWLKTALEADKITREHITLAIDVIGRVVDARLQAGLLNIETTQKIRGMVAGLRVDTERAENAAHLFERIGHFMDRETKSQIVAEIIRAQLGVGK